ncbi:MAG: hypothetical protein Q9195_002471 [Heterodermia aff. obscurata]
MDPVTAFSLAAGVLQIIDMGFKASSMCKEIYTDGSLAQHRDAAELTTFLAETTERLERSIQNTSRPVSDETRNVLEVSKKCSAIAKELLAELRKLRAEPGDGLLSAIRKSTRAVRRKDKIQKIETKLREYQDMLNTRILSKLDAHAVQQNAKFETLDQSIKDLANQLSQGHDAVVQSLNNQTVALRAQLGGKFDDQVHTQAIERAKQQFKDSLFFPEMFSRQDDIPKSHTGTCRWIFGPTQVNPGDSSTYSSGGKEPSRDVPAYRWDNFTTWLNSGGGLYWLSGKPGSGKSTLMKYMTSEFRNFCQAGVAMPGWGSGSDLVTCSFFFWAPGNSLQKNYVGFLRSLLYQIAEQRDDLIPLMVGQNMMQEGGPGFSREAMRIHAWTKERLDDALKRFLSGKPSSIRVCLFIDGLDEFAGDEDLLLETLRLLSGTPRTHVCVSSRPEQIFRQGFAQSPQLKLQDLNHRDIEKTVKDRLGTTLSEKFPNLPEVIDEFEADVISRSEGIFLWTELIVKDLQRGARNSDNLQELRERFDRMPDTIQGLYQHMLGRLERPYLQEAAGYFQLLMAEADYEDLGLDRNYSLTLLDCACAEKTAWSNVLSHDLAYFQSPEFHDSCRNLETRILTRCSGLVEISEHRERLIDTAFWDIGGGYRDVHTSQRYCGVHISQEASSVSCFLRRIQFIHKTVIEFLRPRGEFFLDPDWRLTAADTVTRGRLGVLSLIPNMICKNDAPSGSLKMTGNLVADSLARCSWMEAMWSSKLSRQVNSDKGIQVVSQAYEILGYLNESLNGSDHSLHDFFRYYRGQEPSWYMPFHDCIGFAAHFGQYGYVSKYTARTNRSSQEVEYVLFCTLSGFSCSNKREFIGIIPAACAMQDYCKIVMGLAKYSKDPEVNMKTAASALDANWNIKLAAFLKSSSVYIHIFTSPTMHDESRLHVIPSLILWKNAVAHFLDRGADANTILQSRIPPLCSDKFVAGRRQGLSFATAETLLGWVERMLANCDPDVRKEVEDTVISYGGQHQRTILSLNIGENVYRMTQEQSDRLLHAWAWEDGSLPETTPEWDELEVVGSGKELSLIPPTSPDPTTERKLNILLDNIDRFRLTKEFFETHNVTDYTSLDFGD